MSTTVMTEPVAIALPRSAARTAGFFWLITFLAGIFAMFSFQTVVVSGDAAATAANILAQEPFYRFGIFANLIASVSYIAATLFIYYLLKPVNRNVALLSAFFSLTGCAVSCVSFVFDFAPLVVLRGLSDGAVFTVEQLQVQARMFLRVGEYAENVAFVFFGLHVFLVGYLILRSTFLHRIVGVLMLFGGLGWLTYAVANLLSPPLAGVLSPWILIPGALGEGSLIVWLLVKGVNVDRWMEQTRVAGVTR
jgi:uncharacterized protein DUF4386